MAIRGERFHINLDDDLVNGLEHNQSPRNPWSLVADIQERLPSTIARPPSPPRISSSRTGFPDHKKRPKPLTFKQRSGHPNTNDGKPKVSGTSSGGLEAVSSEKGRAGETERQEIDKENRQRIAGMSPEDIDQARRELMSGLSGSLIERLLKKAYIEEQPEGIGNEEYLPEITPSGKEVNFEAKVSESGVTQGVTQLQQQNDPSALDDEKAPVEPPHDLQPVSTFSGYPAIPSFHFPRPPTPPSLNPEDPEFLSKLHSTYFPSLPSNPNALSWMQPPDATESDVYSPSRDDLPPSAVRFDFKGRLLPPRLAAQIPITKGLHHHGTAPGAAGYTVPELAHLSRSSFPAQRCIAYQTLGRILYRLGMGVFGPEDHELCQGLWKCIEQGRVLDTLTSEAARGGESGNRSCWVTATEAVWLWRKGGGRKWKAT
ncbi:MAG: hypothetical protein Q9170_000979 [Blastenia crenularia]